MTVFQDPGASGRRVEVFTDQFAPVRMDPETGTRETWTRARFIAAGYDVRDIAPDLWAVDFDSKREALPPGVEPPVA